MTCDLCTLEKRTKWYYDDDEFVIIDCKTCNIPMMVTKQHIMEPSPILLESMIKTAKNLFGEDITFRKKQRKIKSHWHWHCEVNYEKH